MSFPTPPLDWRFDDNVLFQDSMLNHRVYTDREIFARELDEVFGRAWIYLGHESQLPSPRSFFLAHIGRVSIIVSRDRDGVLHALHNRCAHRGPPVCMERTGSASAFICPYHGWTYGLDGRLRGMPVAQDYGEEFPREERGLERVARLGNYRGFLFGSLASDGPDLTEFLGEALQVFDNFVDRSPAGRIAPVSVPLRHRLRANWKVVFENLNDTLHPLFAHASVAAAGRDMMKREAVGGTSQLLAQDQSKILAGLHAVGSVITQYGHSFQPGLGQLIGAGNESAAAHHAELVKAKGLPAADAIMNNDVYVAVVYPSVLVKPGSQSIRVIRPISHDDTEVSTFLFALEGAPDEVLREAYDYHSQLGSPASPVLTDDLRIYEMIQADYARDYAVSVERGGAQEAAGERPNGTSEAYIRGQYDTWTAYMAGRWP